MILETERLLLREYVEEDAEAFFRLNSDPEVLRFTGDNSLLSVTHAREILCAHPMADYRKYGFGRCACILKRTGENIGYAGLKYLEEFDEVEIGFRLMRAHWGCGFAAEASIAAIRCGFDQLALKTIIGLALPENVASVRVLEKAGLRFSGTAHYRGSPVAKYVIARAPSQPA